MDDDVDILMEKANERLDAARDLLEDGHFEDVVSRAYYSMWAAATATLAMKEIYVKTHKGLQIQFRENFIKNKELDMKVGEVLRNATDLRNKADYEILYKITKEQAETILSDTEYFLDQVENLIERLKVK